MTKGVKIKTLETRFGPIDVSEIPEDYLDRFRSHIGFFSKYGDKLPKNAEFCLLTDNPHGPSVTLYLQDDGLYKLEYEELTSWDEIVSEDPVIDTEFTDHEDFF